MNTAPSPTAGKPQATNAPKTSPAFVKVAIANDKATASTQCNGSGMNCP